MFKSNFIYTARSIPGVNTMHSRYCKSFLSICHLNAGDDFLLLLISSVYRCLCSVYAYIVCIHASVVCIDASVVCIDAYIVCIHAYVVCIDASVV